jgi:hypothetical protein
MRELPVRFDGRITDLGDGRYEYSLVDNELSPDDVAEFRRLMSEHSAVQLDPGYAVREELIESFYAAASDAEIEPEPYVTRPEHWQNEEHP